MHHVLVALGLPAAKQREKWGREGEIKRKRERERDTNMERVKEGDREREKRERETGRERGK